MWEVKSKEKDKTASTPLITVSDLQRLKEGEIIILRTRKMPLKTKVVYDWKIDWGYKRDDATYPTREKKTISLFDIKSFVEKKRESKINDMMSNFNSTPSFIPPVMPPIKPNFEKVPTNSKGDNSLDIDDLVKRIDAKIAELEEQEKLEQANSESNQSEIAKTVDNIIDKVSDPDKDNIKIMFQTLI